MSYDTIAPVYKDRVRRILADVGADLKARQAKVLLFTEISRLEREIAFASDQLETLEAQLAPLRDELAELAPETAVLTEETRALKAERDALAVRLHQLERSLEDKTNAMPRLDADIARLEREMPALPPRLKELEARRDALRERKQRLEAEAGPLRESLQALESELAVVASTRDIIAGLVPANIDPEVFATIQDDTQARLDEYLSDVRAAINGATAHNETMQTELRELRLERGELALGKEALERKLQALNPAGFEGVTPESLEAEVARLHDELRTLDERRESATNATHRAQVELLDLEEELGRCVERRDAAEEEVLALTELKKECEGQDVEAAIAVLQAESQALAAEERLNQRLLDEGETTIAPLRERHTALTAECERLREVIDKFFGLLSVEGDGAAL